MAKSNLLETLKNKGKSLDAEMSFFDHLEILRWHIIRSVIAVGVFAVIAFSFYQTLFDNVIIAPKNTDFWTYRMMCKIGEWLNIDGFCVEKIPINIINTEVAGQFMMQINSSLLMAVALGFPYLIFEV